MPTLLAEVELRHRCSDQQTLGALYELYNRGLITYPETQSEQLPGDISETQLSETIRLVCEYADIDVDLWKCNVSREANARLFDLEGQWIAPAIIPTCRPPEGLQSREREIYALIAKRFVTAFNEPTEIMHQRAVVDFLGTSVEIESQVILEGGEGWTELYRPPDLVFSDRRFRKGDEFEVEGVNIVFPVREYSRRELILEMAKSLGHSAVHAGKIIDNLAAHKQITVVNDKVILAPHGKEVAEMIDGDEIADPAQTAEWENRLRQIERGEADPSQVLHDYETCIRSFVYRTRTWVQGRILGKCPLCGAQVILNRQEKVFRCRGLKGKNCGFKIARNILEKFGRKTLLTIEEGRKLMKHEPVKIYGCKAPSGKTYAMTLRVPLPQVNQKYQSLEFLGKEPCTGPAHKTPTGVL